MIGHLVLGDDKTEDLTCTSQVVASDDHLRTNCIFLFPFEFDFISSLLDCPAEIGAT